MKTLQRSNRWAAWLILPLTVLCSQSIGQSAQDAVTHSAPTTERVAPSKVAPSAPIPHAIFCGASTCKYPSASSRSLVVQQVTPERAWLTNRAAKCVKRAESHDAPHPDGDYTRQGAEPYGGAWQFSVKTWIGIGGKGLPYRATPAEQDHRAFLLWSRYGWTQWETHSLCGV